MILLRQTTFDQGLGSEWNQLLVAERQGYSTSVADYHRHRFYEINLILSGNVKILLGDTSEEGRENRLVLTRPGTPHYITCSPDTLYHRLYLLFTDEFIEDYLPEWSQLSTIFGENGSVLTLTAAQTALFRQQLLRIREEESHFRHRLMIYDLLSRIHEQKDNDGPRRQIAPSYILQALTFLDEHCGDRIVAADLAERLHIGRTTLMTEFKRHLGSTMVDYLTPCRLRRAVTLLQGGSTVEAAAALCGFADTSGLVRAFKRCYGVPPRTYLSQLKDKKA